MRNLICISTLVASASTAMAQSDYIDTTYDYLRAPRSIYYYPSCRRARADYYRVPYESIPNYDIRGAQMRNWQRNAMLHAARKSQFMNQWAAQQAGIANIIALKASRRNQRRTALLAGHNPWSRPIKQYKPYRKGDPPGLLKDDAQVAAVPTRRIQLVSNSTSAHTGSTQ